MIEVELFQIKLLVVPILISPLTSNFTDGVPIPIPTLPMLFITNGVESGFVPSSTTKELPVPVCVILTKSSVVEPDAIIDPPTFNVDPSNVKLLSATAEFVVPSEVKILLFDGFDIVLKPVPELPEVADVPELPDVPDEPDVPLVPELPLDPEVADVPLDPLVIGTDDVHEANPIELDIK